VHITVFALPRLAWQQAGQFAADQALKVMLHLLGIIKIMHTAAARQQFIKGLRPAQQQKAQQNNLRRNHFQPFISAVFPAISATAHDQTRQTPTFKAAQCCGQQNLDTGLGLSGH
jgi:hypothetical protein